MGLIVLAIIAILIALILLMRFRLLLSYSGEALKVYVKVLFLRFEIVGSKREKLKKSDFRIRKFRRRRDKVLKKYRIKSAPKKDILKTANKKKTSPIALIKDLKDIIIETLRLSGRHVKIDKFKLKVNVGGMDAANVAINYGYVIQATQYLVTFLEHITNLDKTKRKSAEVKADFKDEKWSANVDIVLSLRVIHALKIAVKAFMGYLKYKRKKKPQAADNGK